METETPVYALIPAYRQILREAMAAPQKIPNFDTCVRIMSETRGLTLEEVEQAAKRAADPEGYPDLENDRLAVWVGLVLIVAMIDHRMILDSQAHHWRPVTIVFFVTAIVTIIMIAAWLAVF